MITNKSMDEVTLFCTRFARKFKCFFSNISKQAMLCNYFHFKTQQTIILYLYSSIEPVF